MAMTGPTSRPRRTPPDALSKVMASSRGVLLGMALVSGIINVMMLTSPLFMMQVYDRVLGSQSVPTLMLLSALVLIAFLFQGGLESIRVRVLALIGERIDEEIGPKVHAAMAELPLRMSRGSHESLQPFRDLDSIRSFLGGPGPAALYDIPWMPFYFVVLFMLHWSIGAFLIVGAVVLIALTIATEIRSSGPMRSAIEAQSIRNHFAEATFRNAEVARAMGMMAALGTRWQISHGKFLQSQRRATFVVGGFATVARLMRMVLQSSILALSAYLAIKQEISAGTIIAATVLGGRALAPIDQAIGSWRGFVSARQGYGRLTRLLTAVPEADELFPLPAPKDRLAVENLVVAAPGSKSPILKRASFSLDAGQGMGIVGPSAAGKSTLARAIVGVWAPLAGKVTLDGTSIDQWSPDALGPSIGYLPQDVQLFEGTIAENIARFSPEASPEKVIKAARAAAFHDAVVAMEDGYNTHIGAAGTSLSAGQRQRIGLARALYGDPFLVVLDEPNANLDGEGEAAVVEAIKSVRSRGGIAVVVAHRPSALAAVDMVLAVKAGEAIAFGPRDAVMSRLMQQARGSVAPLVRPESG